MGHIRIMQSSHICGLHTKLTFEHIPPKAAFNDRPVVSRALKSQYFVYFQLNHAASRLVRNELCAFIELIFSENKHFE